MKSSQKKQEKEVIYYTLSELATRWEIDRGDLLRVFFQRVFPRVVNSETDDLLVPESYIPAVEAKLKENGSI